MYIYIYIYTHISYSYMFVSGEPIRGVLSCTSTDKLIHYNCLLVVAWLMFTVLCV